MFWWLLTLLRLIFFTINWPLFIFIVRFFTKIKVFKWFLIFSLTFLACLWSLNQSSWTRSLPSHYPLFWCQTSWTLVSMKFEFFWISIIYTLWRLSLIDIILEAVMIRYTSYTILIVINYLVWICSFVTQFLRLMSVRFFRLLITLILILRKSTFRIITCLGFWRFLRFLWDIYFF